MEYEIVLKMKDVIMDLEILENNKDLLILSKDLDELLDLYNELLIEEELSIENGKKFEREGLYRKYSNRFDEYWRIYDALNTVFPHKFKL